MERSTGCGPPPSARGCRSRCSAHFLQAIGQIAERHPGLKLIIDHFGRPDAAWSNLPDLVALAKHPNVALKATGAPSYSSEPYPYRDIHGHIRQLYDAFGPSACSGAPTSRACRARGGSA